MTSQWIAFCREWNELIYVNSVPHHRITLHAHFVDDSPAEHEHLLEPCPTTWLFARELTRT